MHLARCVNSSLSKSASTGECFQFDVGRPELELTCQVL